MTAAIDRAQLAQLAEDVLPEDLLRIVGAFMSDADRLCPVLRDCAAAGDVARFARTAHAIAGAAGAVAATALERLAREAMQAPGPDLRATASAIEAAAAEAAAELDRLIAQGGMAVQAATPIAAPWGASAA